MGLDITVYMRPFVWYASAKYTVRLPSIELLTIYFSYSNFLSSLSFNIVFLSLKPTRPFITGGIWLSLLSFCLCLNLHGVVSCLPIPPLTESVTQSTSPGFAIESGMRKDRSAAMEERRGDMGE